MNLQLADFSNTKVLLLLLQQYDIKNMYGFCHEIENHTALSMDKR